MKRRFRDMLQANKWLKYVPNSLTLCNSLCGFLAILITLRAYEARTVEDSLTVFFSCAVIICCAMIFDSLDGLAARIFNAASMHGVQMDSLADMVTFGVAPATLVAIMTHSLRAPSNIGRTEEVLIYLLCSVYLGCAAPPTTSMRSSRRSPARSSADCPLPAPRPASASWSPTPGSATST